MARAAVAILLSAALAGVLAGRGGTQNAQRLLAEIGQGSVARLTAVEPLTLAPVGRSTQIGYYTWPWALSPGGKQIVLARQSPGFFARQSRQSRQSPASLRFVDLRTMRTLRAVRLTGETSVESINWISPRLLLAAVDNVEVIAVDPVKGRIRWREYLPDESEAVARTGNGFVFLISSYLVHPGDEIGPTTLATVDKSGAVRSVLLDRVLSGEYQDEQDQSVFTSREPGLVVDRAGNRAYVVGAGEPVAEVDLSTLAVTYHGGSRRLAKGDNGPFRAAHWLDNGRIAVTGYDSRTWKDTAGQQQAAETPAGLTLIDTHDWTSRLIDSNTTGVTVAGDFVLASGSFYDTSSASAQAQGVGVTVYDLGGNRRFHLFDGPVGVQAVGGTAYIYDRSQIAVVDLASGSVVNTVTPTNGLGLLTPEP